jgi:WD40 repeat protein
MHCWTITTEPLAGNKLSEPKDQNERLVAYSPSPDGRLVAIFAYKQWGPGEPWVFDAQGRRIPQKAPDGVVIVRDLESGQDLAELLHNNSGRLFERVAWSADSQRLATFARPFDNAPQESGRITVWDVTKKDVLCQITEFAEKLSLSPDGSLVYCVFTGCQTSGTIGPDRPRTAVYRVADGSLVASRKLDCNQLVFSPDGKRIAASTRTDVELMDSSTLEAIWRSPGGEFNQIVFRSDGGEMAALGVDLSGLVRRFHVKAWSTADGTVLLDAPRMRALGLDYISFGKDGAIWTIDTSRWNRFALKR